MIAYYIKLKYSDSKTNMFFALNEELVYKLNTRCLIGSLKQAKIIRKILEKRMLDKELLYKDIKIYEVNLKFQSSKEIKL